eukprot:9608050-Karenia_brevis.AAC.1
MSTEIDARTDTQMEWHTETHKESPQLSVSLVVLLTAGIGWEEPNFDRGSNLKERKERLKP